MPVQKNVHVHIYDQSLIKIIYFLCRLWGHVWKNCLKSQDLQWKRWWHPSQTLRHVVLSEPMMKRKTSLMKVLPPQLVFSVIVCRQYKEKNPLVPCTNDHQLHPKVCLACLVTHLFKRSRIGVTEIHNFHIIVDVEMIAKE